MYVASMTFRKLAHVSRPAVTEKGVKKVLFKAVNVAAETRIHLATEVIRQQNNIVLAVSERWQWNLPTLTRKYRSFLNVPSATDRSMSLFVAAMIRISTGTVS